uniref:Glutathione peroxidase 7 n=1 Tax=Cricetulus griseus TaxID=10029 RepID=A0A8C2QN45_CRIGR
MVATVAAAWLLLWATACAKSEQDFYDFKAVNIRGKLVSLDKYRGSRLLGRSLPGTSGST